MSETLGILALEPMKNIAIAKFKRLINKILMTFIFVLILISSLINVVSVAQTVTREQILFSGKNLDISFMGYRYSGPYSVSSGKTIRIEWAADRLVIVYILNEVDWKSMLLAPTSWRATQTAQEGSLQFKVQYPDVFYIVVMGAFGSAARLYMWTEKLIWQETISPPPSPSPPSSTITTLSITVTTPITNAPVVVVDQVQFATDKYGKVEVQVQPGLHTISVQEYYTITPNIRWRFIKWTDGTKSTTITLNVLSDLTISAQYKRQYLVNFVFQDVTGTRTINPDSVTVVSPDGSFTTLTRYSSLWLDEGEWEISEILWHGIRVELDSYKRMLVRAPGEFIICCAVYDVKVTVQDTLGFKVTGAEVRITLPHGTTHSQTTNATGIAFFTSVPRGRFSISIAYMGFTTAFDGDASIENNIIITVPMSIGTLVVVITIMGMLGGTAYLMLRKRWIKTAYHMTICPNCGSKVPKWAFFCPSCGYELEQRTPPPP